MTVKAKVDAIDSFVRTLKSSGQWNDINAAAIMAGWTNLAGALYPLKGSAPTNNGFVDADLDAGIGLKGDGSSYLNSNRAGNANGQNDQHMACYAASRNTLATGVMIGSGRNAFTGTDQIANASSTSPTGLIVFSRLGTALAYDTVPDAINSFGLQGISRSDASGYVARANGGTTAIIRTSATPVSDNIFVFDRNPQGAAAAPTDATLSWYSIGSATDLAALDSAVSTLMSDLRSIDEAGFDRDAVRYLRAVEAADGGSFLETGVKQAINRFIVGCKKDGIWDAIKASCILCGARTLAGALVPLAGDAPTSYNFASGDYDRETGLLSDGSTKYLDSNRAGNADGQDDAHIAIYRQALVVPATSPFSAGVRSTAFGNSYTGLRVLSTGKEQGWCRSDNAVSLSDCTVAGFRGVSRSDSSQYDFLYPSASVPYTYSRASIPHDSKTTYIFGINFDGVFQASAAERIAFYSVGSSLSLSALDTRVTNLITEIAAAIP